MTDDRNAKVAELVMGWRTDLRSGDDDYAVYLKSWVDGQFSSETLNQHAPPHSVKPPWTRC